MPEFLTPSPEEMDALHEEALEFNEMIDSGKTTKEYVSVLPKEQTPEQTGEIIKNAEKYICDVNAFGVLAHGSRGVDREVFNDILLNGLRPPVETRSAAWLEASRFSSLFQEHVSFGMNGVGSADIETFGDRLLEFNDASQYGVEKLNRHPRDQKRAFERLNFTFIANPEFVTRSLELWARDGSDRKTRPVLLTGSSFEWDAYIPYPPEKHGYKPSQVMENITATDNTKRRLVLNYLASAGWVKAAYPGDHHEATRTMDAARFNFDFARTNDDAFYGEVVLSNKYKDQIDEPMINGVVIDPRDSAQAIRWLNQLALDDPQRAVPLYDIEGNVLWPVQMSKEQSRANDGEKLFQESLRGRKFKHMQNKYVYETSPDYGKDMIFGAEQTENEAKLWTEARGRIDARLVEYQKDGIDKGSAQSMAWLNDPQVSIIFALMARKNGEIRKRLGSWSYEVTSSATEKQKAILDAYDIIISKIVVKVLHGVTLTQSDYAIETYPEYKDIQEQHPELDLPDPAHVIWHSLIQNHQHGVFGFVPATIEMLPDKREKLITGFQESVVKAGGKDKFFMQLAENFPENPEN